MRVRPKVEGFGFTPKESVHHFVVTIPASNREEVLISEHFSYDEAGERSDLTFNDGASDGKLRVLLARPKWNAIADEVRIEFNRRLKKDGLPSGRWKTGVIPLSRLLGKELVMLAWAIEDADPALIPHALKNWLGLVPEERWWLFTMPTPRPGTRSMAEERAGARRCGSHGPKTRSLTSSMNLCRCSTWRSRTHSPCPCATGTGAERTASTRLPRERVLMGWQAK